MKDNMHISASFTYLLDPHSPVRIPTLLITTLPRRPGTALAIGTLLDPGKRPGAGEEGGGGHRDGIGRCGI
jgi:hypothetical protein